ncbi:MAG: amino acid adenylation domain-containing protein [Acidobacteriota bacterium]
MSGQGSSSGASRRQLLELLLRRRARQHQQGTSAAGTPSSGAPSSPVAANPAAASPAADSPAADSPLAVGQRALWYIHRLAPESHAYNVVFATKILSAVDVEAMLGTWRRLVERHPGLRLRVEETAEGQLQQRFQAPGEDALEQVVPMTVVDAAGWSEERVEEELRRIAEKPFDLVDGPVARVALLQRSADDWALILVAHHIAVDFWSFGVLLDELHRLYPAQRAHLRESAPEPALPAPAATYADYVEWQRQLLEGPKGESQWSYWREQLAGDLPVLELPTDRPRPAVQSYRGASLTFPMDAELTAALRTFSRQRGLTPFVTLLAVLSALLMRLSGQREVRIGAPMLGRNRPEFERLVGFFANMVVLRTRPTPEAGFESFAAGLKEVVYGALEHQDYPFAQLVEKLELPRDPSRGPLFDVAFSVESPRMDVHGISRLLLGEAGARTELAGLTMEALPLAQQEGQFDLMFHLLEIGDVIAGILPFNADLYDLSTARRLAGWFVELCRGAVANPHASLEELPLLDSAERQQVVTWSRQGLPLAGRAWSEAVATVVDTVPAAVARVAAAAPQRIALEMVVPGSEDGLQRLTFAELLVRSRRLAHRLKEVGAGPEGRVAVCADRGLDAVTAVLAVLEAGAAFVPLDPAYPAERLRFMAQDGEVGIVLVQDSLRQQLPPLEANWLSLDAELQSVDREEAAGGAPPAPAAAAIGPDSLAYIMYTSGSTGRPKGVAVTHRSILRLTLQDRFADLGAEQTFLLMAPLSFDASTLEIWAPLTRGGRLAVLPPGTPALPEIGEALARHGVTTLWLTAGLFHRMVDEEIGSLAPLRQLLAGGDVLSPPHVRKVLEAHPHLRVINGYGPTENTTFTCCWPMDSAAEVISPVPVGRPIGDTSVYLVDRRFELQPPGVPGELVTGGEGLARGYIGRPALTAERFVPNPFARSENGAGSRLYRTGDLARWREDGSVEFLGRIDSQVKIRGFRIEPGEVQSALADLPEVAEAVVVVRELGSTGKHLVAYAVPDTAVGAASAPAPEALREALAETLPDHMVPRFVVLLDELPLNTNGKVDRKALPDPRAAAAGPAATASEGMATDSHSAAAVAVAVGQPLTRALEEIFRQALDLPRLDPDANFFDLGAHSLLLAQTHSRILKELGGRLEVQPQLVDLLHRPTLRSLAGYLVPTEHRRAEAAASEVESRAAVSRPRREEGVAVVGVAGRFPGAEDVDTLWRRLMAGEELITGFSDDQLEAGGLAPDDPSDPLWVKRGGVLEDVDRFDAAFFGYSPREAEGLDPQQRLFLEVAWHALEDAGYGDPELLARRGLRVGVFAGTGASTYLRYHLLANASAARSLGEYQLLLGNDKDFLATRVSYKLDLKGPAVVVQSACSTSLVAVHMAAESLAAGECDLAIAGGANVRLPQRAGYRYEQGMILSPDGHCRAFDADARGTVPGNGVAAVVLRPAGAADAAGDPVRAVVKGSAINNDGSLKAGYTAPSVEGQAQVLADALAAADIDPRTVGYIEAHGTGTELGDPIEVAALNQVYGAGGEVDFEPGSALIGSLKSNLGHLDSAAGIAGFIKAVLAVERGEIPPSLHFQQPNPKIDFDSGPFRVAAEVSAFPRFEEAPRRAAVSSFGVGGTNAHVILEQAAAKEGSVSGTPSNTAQGPYLLPVSGATEEALEANIEALVRHLELNPELPLDAVTFTLQSGRKTLPHRRYTVLPAGAGSAEAAALQNPDHYFQRHEERRHRDVAFLFPGQGAQYPGMIRGLYDAYAVVRESVDHAAEVLAQPLGLDLRQLLFPAAGEQEEAAVRLAQTSITQPALFAVEYALAQLWMSWGLTPRSMIGHSIGEYVAATLAGVFTVEDGLWLVAERGRLIQALPAGDMISLPLSVLRVEEILADHPQLSLAAANGSRLCVASGPAEAVEALRQELDAGVLPEGRVAARKLHTSHAFHSAMMDDALPAFREAVAKVPRSAPRIPFVSNVSGRWITAEEAQDPDYWTAHLRGAVRFADGIKTLVTTGEDPLLLEVGPGKTLSTLVRRLGLKSEEGPVRSVQSTRHPVSEADDREVLAEALGQLWLGGVTMDWDSVSPPSSGHPRRLPLPGYRFADDRYWIEADGSSGGAAVGAPATSASLLWRPYWRSSLPPVPGPAGDGAVALVGEGGGLAAALEQELRSAGWRVLRLRVDDGAAEPSAEPPPVGPGADGWLSVFEYLAGSPEGLPRHWVYLGAAEIPGEAAGDGLEERLARSRGAGVDRLRGFARAVVRHPLEGEGAAQGYRLTAVSVGVESVDGRETLLPERASMPALARGLPREIPGLEVRTVDLAPWWGEASNPQPRPTPQVVQALGREVHAFLTSSDSPTGAPTPFAAKAEDSVALRTAGRWIQDYEALPAAAESATASQAAVEGAWWVVGGLGRVGCALAVALARSGADALGLILRQPPPGDEAEGGEEPPVRARRRRWQQLRELDIPLAYEVADLGDEAALRGAVEGLEKTFGRPRGVIQAAGESRVETLGSTADLGCDAFDAHFQVTVRGFSLLDRVLGRQWSTGSGSPSRYSTPRPSMPRTLVVGSAFSRFGAAGLGPHAAAHAYATAFAQRRSRASSPSALDPSALAWQVLAWDAWQPEADAEVVVRGGDPASAMDEQGAARALATVLAQDHHSVAATPWLVVSRRTPADLQRGAEEETPAQPTARRRSVDTPYLEPSSEVEWAVAAVWEELLGVRPVGARDDFFDLGGHSLLGTRVLSRLQQSYGVELPLSVLFRHSTLSALAAEVDRQRAAAPATDLSAAAAASSALPGLEGSGGMELDVEGLSDDQVTALLEGMIEDDLELEGMNLSDSNLGDAELGDVEPRDAEFGDPESANPELEELVP